MELRAIACVEAQLGEPLREDGLILGMELDPLPPDASGAPIAMVEQQKQSAHPYDGKTYERHDAKLNKRSFREYQFLQDQSSIRSDRYGQVSQSPYHDPPVDNPRGRASFINEDEPLARVYGGQGQTSHVCVLSQTDKKGHIFSSSHKDDDYHLHHDSFANNRISVQSISHPIMGYKNPDIFPDAIILHSDADLWMEKKFKIDEAGLIREAEAHEHRMRKEFEKQDQLRQKSEERIRKGMERHDHERRKEEEMLMRERQREEERSLREQKRELEPREKFLQKEYLRAEKKGKRRNFGERERQLSAMLPLRRELHAELLRNLSIL